MSDDDMPRASTYLRPDKNSKHKTRKVTEDEVEENRVRTKLTIRYLIENGIQTEMPETRSECPTQRPCPFVSCRYNMWADVTSFGSIKVHFNDIEPWEVAPSSSCALDVAEEGPMKTKQIGKYFGLTQERIRQIQNKALKKLEDEINER